MRLTKAQRTMLLLGLVPLLALLVAGVGVTVGMIRGRLGYNSASEFAAPAQGVRIASDVPTEVLASVDGKVHVTVSGSYAAAKPDIRISPMAGALTIGARCPDVHCNVDLTVEVPAETAVEAKVEQVSLDVAGVASPLTLDATGGSVNLARVRSPDVSVNVRGGSITLFFDNPPNRVRATASDGSITVQVPRTVSYGINAVAAQGSTDLSVPNDQSATHQLYLRTRYGSITVQ
ncbi:DUF4097 family beta strand repeat-containing protein [Kribbella sp. NPDC050459]|uniref:DUF4097 family beta strand repeat-containing protein n=1 Tax=Kribbella sp. NPDC050459 TaxID=3155785 RepID=UPI003406571C